MTIAKNEFERIHKNTVGFTLKNHKCLSANQYGKKIMFDDNSIMVIKPGKKSTWSIGYADDICGTVTFKDVGIHY